MFPSILAEKSEATGPGGVQMSRKPIKTVLVIEDNPGDARLLREMLNEQDPRYIELTHVECMRDAETYLARHAADEQVQRLGIALNA